MASRRLLSVTFPYNVHLRFGSVYVTHGSDIKAKTRAPVVNKIQLDKFASYNQVAIDRVDPRISSGLVLLLPWALAKENHVAKFENYYLSKGFNVLTVLAPPRHLFLSKLYRKKLLTVVQELHSPTNIKPFDKMLVHAFSIGHFVLGQIIVEMDKMKRNQARKIQTSVVLDSPLDYRALILALVRTFPFPLGMQDSLHPFCNLLWMKLIPGLGVKSNESVYERIHKETFDRALILTSKVDPIGTEDYAKQLMEIGRANGTRVTGKIFESSPHVMHFVKHQKEYLNLLEPFVQEFIQRN